MACCAFAVFLLSQLFAPLRALARRLGLARQWQPDAAVEWRPGVPTDRPRARIWKRLLVAFIAVDLAGLGLVGAAAAATSPAGQPADTTFAFEQAIHKSICGSLGWRD